MITCIKIFVSFIFLVIFCCCGALIINEIKEGNDIPVGNNRY